MTLSSISLSNEQALPLALLGFGCFILALPFMLHQIAERWREYWAERKSPLDIHYDENGDN